MRVVLVGIGLSLIATLLLHVAQFLHFPVAILCLQPLLFLGLIIAAVALFVLDSPSRSYFLRPVSHKNTWAEIFLTAYAMLLASLLFFRWYITDPTGEVEGASMFFGHPLPWIMSGYFYAGFGGEYILQHGGYGYIFLSQPWYTNPVLLPTNLLLDGTFFLALSLVLHRLILRTPPRATTTS
jgi:hypothetical protein